jgi:hypothetical protein
VHQEGLEEAELERKGAMLPIAIMALVALVLHQQLVEQA